MKFNKDWLKEKWVAYTIAACSAVLFYVLLSNINLLLTAISAIYGYIKPVFFGLIIAYIMDPLVKVFEKRVFSNMQNTAMIRLLSVFCTVVAVLVFIIVLMVMLVPQIIDSISGFISNFSKYISGLQALIGTLGSTASEGNVDISGITDTVNKLLQSLSSIIPSSANRIINTSYSIGMSVFNITVSFILAIYFLADKKRLLVGTRNLGRLIISEKAYRRISTFLMKCHLILVRYIGFDIIDGLIVGIANFIFMKIAGMPYGVLIAVLCGVTNLAPTFGPIVGGAIGAFILLLVNPWYALWFLIFTFIIQLIDGYVLKPKLFGGTFGVSSIAILIAIIVGGRVLGVWGILIAIPLTAILDFVYKEYILDRLRQRKAAEKEKEHDEITGSDILSEETDPAKQVKASDGIAVTGDDSL